MAAVNMHGPINYDPEPVPMNEYQVQTISTATRYMYSGSGTGTGIGQLVFEIEEAYVRGTNAEGLLWSFWIALFSLARQLPHDRADDPQQKLISLFQALKVKAEPSVTAEVLERVGGKLPWSPRPIWSNLAIWSYATHEEFDEWLADRHDPRKRMCSIEEWLNVNAFLAQLTSAGVCDLSFLGLATLRWGLEEEDNRTPINSDDRQDADVLVRTAAIWMLYSGPSMRMAGMLRLPGPPVSP